VGLVPYGVVADTRDDRFAKTILNGLFAPRSYRSTELDFAPPQNHLPSIATDLTYVGVHPSHSCLIDTWGHHDGKQ
jgi:hypothetical protein